MSYCALTERRESYAHSHVASSTMTRVVRRRLDLDLNLAPALTQDLVVLLDLTREHS